MSRIWLRPAAMVLLAGAASAADGASDTTEAVMRECSAPDIPAAAVDPCLERVRILEETDTSAGLASLEARLEARVASDHEPVGPVPSTNRSVEVRPYSAGPGGGSDAGPAETDAAEAATGAPRSLESEGPPAAPAENAGVGGEEGGNAAPDAGVSAAANAAAASPPPDVSPDDEPPIADPPDSDAPQAGE